ncbi:alpha/beta-hydrolase [Lactifluus volemus]|nr:alpha/beta-hydrolase [Lactifluus volemus]
MASPSLAAHPRQCCIQSVPHTGTPIGSIETLASTNTYITRGDPPRGDQDKNQQILLYFSDVFGPLYVNNQLLMDYFASRGYLVASLDYFEGDKLETLRAKPGFDLAAWGSEKHSRAKELIPGWIAAVKAKYGTEGTKYMAVGYCFGAPHALEAAASDLLVACAIAHPSSVTEDHLKNLRTPLFLSCAEVDGQFPPNSRHRAETILAERRLDYHLQLFGGVSHGFAVRGNPEVPREKYAKEESARGILGWFDRFSK